MNKSNKTSVSLDFASQKLTLETGSLANQASSSILARLGDTMVLATVVEGQERPDLGYFPLSVEYVERLYAGGRIKGSRWVKREGRPTDDAILTGRLIDRSIRPLFPKEYSKEVQVMVTVLSVDGENEPDILSIIAVSAALSISSVPWLGPVGAVRMGFVKEPGKETGELIVNPQHTQIESSDLDLVVSQTKEATLMLEAGALQVAEAPVFDAIKKAHEVNKLTIAFIEDFAKKLKVEKGSVDANVAFQELVARIEKTHKSEIAELVQSSSNKESTKSVFEGVIDDVFNEEKLANPSLDIDKKSVAKAVEKIFFKSIREGILKKGKRPDGRAIDEIRPISCEVGILPRTHGSALFQRGHTQALTVVTLGSPKMEQLIESAEGEESKRYIHHYSMPPYSVGEAGRVGVPSRREIGHGALAERAIIPVIPKQEKFPYTIRVVSEILSSNGSTSMAATCGSTLALMDAGVPIEKPVSGIAMGLVSDKDKYVVLSDIIGLEDFSGDMDFKVAGTDSGITAIQLDVKIHGISLEQIAETLEKAKKGRLFILEKMMSALSTPREAVSTYAPKIEVLKIPVEKIGEVIGPGGRMIRNIQGQTNATIDIEDDGTITVSGAKEEEVRKATDWISGMTKEIMVGESYEGTVKRMLPFGAFVEFLPGREGMVHVSQMAQGFVKDPSDVVKIGQMVKVKVIEIDEQGRVNLSMVDKEKRSPEGQGGPKDIIPKAPQSEHPLTMQFRRERMGRDRGFGRNPRQKNPRFRKTHY